MNPYQDLFFFYIMGLLLLPAIVFGLLEKPILRPGLFFTAGMLGLVYSLNGRLIALIAFYLFETALCLLFQRVRNKTGAKFRLFLFLALLPLVAIKLSLFFAPLGIAELLGVSYMTFRAVGVIIDLYDNKLSEFNIIKFSYFLLFFPSVTSGPIDRYRRFLGDLSKSYSRGEYLAMLRRGVFRLMCGAFSATVVSGLIFNLWLQKLPESGFLPTLSYMYGYTLYLFFNFAGYSGMAIGTAYILGVKLPENFNMPFLSVDMKDFWTRWHMSLSAWLRDHVYMRFVMASLKSKRYKKQRTPSYLGYLITMLLMGAWHGLTPAYLAYGVYHGLLMCLNEALDLHVKAFKKMKRHPVAQLCLVAVTFHLFSFGLLIFSGRLF